MEIKLIEIRDAATFIPAMAVRLTARDEAEFYLLRRAGYSKEQIAPQGMRGFKPSRADTIEPYIVLVKLGGVEAQYDPFGWPNQRTMGAAHRWIIEHWGTIQTGDVVDVEFILGETTQPKLSERLSGGV